MNNPTTPTTDLSLVSLTQNPSREILDNSIAEYLTFLRRQPILGSSPEQQENLIKRVALGHDLIKLIGAERLKITHELDHQKHDRMELEKQRSFAITDPNKVTNGHWIVVESAIEKAVAEGARKILGVRIYEEAITTFRR